MRRKHNKPLMVLIIISLLIFLGNPGKENYKKYFKENVNQMITWEDYTWENCWMFSYERNSFLFFSSHHSKSYIGDYYHEVTYLGFGFFKWVQFYKINSKIEAVVIHDPIEPDYYYP